MSGPLRSTVGFSQNLVSMLKQADCVSVLTDIRKNESFFISTCVHGQLKTSDICTFAEMCAASSKIRATNSFSETVFGLIYEAFRHRLSKLS
jgi:hypothetical protein